MSVLSKDDISKLVKSVDSSQYSHFIIMIDKFDYEYIYRYVEYGEDPMDYVREVESHGSSGIFGLLEIYNLTLDIDSQLDERRAMHPEIVQKKKEDDVIDEEDSVVRKAVEFAKKAHKGQYRTTGEEYVWHPIRVAGILKKYKQSHEMNVLLCAAYLHDVVEDTPYSFYDIVANFGPQVAELVLELTTDEDMKNVLGKTKYLQIKMKNMSNWALTIKLCDRLDNCHDLLVVSQAFKEKYVNETIEILEYLVSNRDLTSTQRALTSEILRVLVGSLDVDDDIRRNRCQVISRSLEEKCIENSSFTIRPICQNMV